LSLSSDFLVQASAFECNLYHYIEALGLVPASDAAVDWSADIRADWDMSEAGAVVGLYKLNPVVDP
jgi:hypothetical protein